MSGMKTMDQIDIRASQYYEAGNAAVKAQSFDSALQAYQQALRLLVNSSTSSSGGCNTSFPLEGNALNEKQLMWIRCQLNAGFCHFKLRNYFDAIDANTAILDAIDLLQLLRLETVAEFERKEPVTQSANDIDVIMLGFQLKALLRRSAAYEYIEEYEHALEDVHKANRLQPSNTSSQSQTIVKLQSLLQQDKKTLEQTPLTTGVLAVDAPSSSSNTTRYQGKLVNVAQSLRLIFRKVPEISTLHLHSYCMNSSKKTVRRSQPIAYKLALGNEFGLFARHLYTNSAEQSQELAIGRLRCRLINIRNINNTKYGLSTVGNNVDEFQHSVSWPLPHDGKTSIHLRIVTDGEEINESSIEHDVVMLEFSIEDFAKPHVQIVPIISLPLEMVWTQQSDGSSQHIDQTFATLKMKEDIIQATCIRPIVVKTQTSAHDVFVYESPGLLGIGGKVWDSSFILVDYCGKHFKEYLSNKVVLELGCGTGVTGLSLSYFSPKKVILTDMKEVVPLLDLNITLHQLILDATHQQGKTLLTGMDLFWGIPLQDQNGQLTALGEQLLEVDTIVASDVVYYPEGYEPLINTISSILRLPSLSKRKMILAHRHRHPQDQDFFDGMYALPDIAMEEIDWMDDYFHHNANAEKAKGSLHDVRLFNIFVK